MAAEVSRETVLASIRRAVGDKTSPGGPRDVEHRDVDGSVLEIRRRLEQQRGDLIEQFSSELTKVGGRFHRAASVQRAIAYINEAVSAVQAKKIIAWKTGLVSGLDLSNTFEAKGIRFITETPEDQFIEVAAAADIGISAVDYALADTGTLVLLAGKSQPRSVSLLPPVHIALLTPDQIISGLDDLFPLLRHDRQTAGAELSSAITFITGPSRTADIELTLVVGVHGPQQLHAVLVES